MPSLSETTGSAAARKQALQDQVLVTIQGRRLAGIALTMGLGKTLIGLRDMDRLLAAGQLLDQAAGKSFLVAAPTQAILDSWPQEAHKFGLAHLLDHITFTTYRSLGKVLTAGTYHKLYLDECHALKDSHEPGLKAHAARKRSILGLTGTPPAQAHSEKSRLVATYCPIVVDYTTAMRPCSPACSTTTASWCTGYRCVVYGTTYLPPRRVASSPPASTRTTSTGASA